ncbi:MAG: MopE-related protein [bacterium]
MRYERLFIRLCLIILVIFLTVKIIPCAGAEIISNIRVSNLNESGSATISWITDISSTGSVYYKSPTMLEYERAQDTKTGYTHYVKITRLSPNTVYSFYVETDGVIDNNNAAFYSFKTFPYSMPTLPGNELRIGTIESSGDSLSNDGILFLRAKNENSESCLVSARIDKGESWEYVLGNLRSDNGAPYSLHEGDHLLVIEVEGVDEYFPSRAYPYVGNLTEIATVRLEKQASATDDDQDGYSEDQGDCDDNDPARFPNNPEICDGKDNDCDELIDEDVSIIYYLDADADGYGDINQSIELCTPPLFGYVNNAGDCDDSDTNVHPGAEEVFDGKDNNCNGVIDEGIDEGATTRYYADADADGYGNPLVFVEAATPPQGYVTLSTDCDDDDLEVYPGAGEICDGKDNDCDGKIDEGLMGIFYEDADADGYGNINVKKEACFAPSGYVANSKDCNDNDKNSYPGAEEVFDGKDNDCDGVIDEGIATKFYVDTDGDGYGNPLVFVEAANAPPGYVANAHDCDDDDEEVYPGADEICDGKDNNCNNSIDEGMTTLYYADADGDGFGDSTLSFEGCSIPSGYVTIGGDCNDSHPAINPYAEDIFDGIDNDCSGNIDEGCYFTLTINALEIPQESVTIGIANIPFTVQSEDAGDCLIIKGDTGNNIEDIRNSGPTEFVWFFEICSTFPGEFITLEWDPAYLSECGYFQLFQGSTPDINNVVIKNMRSTTFYSGSLEEPGTFIIRLTKNTPSDPSQPPKEVGFPAPYTWNWPTHYERPTLWTLPPQWKGEGLSDQAIEWWNSSVWINLQKNWQFNNSH